MATMLEEPETLRAAIAAETVDGRPPDWVNHPDSFGVAPLVAAIKTGSLEAVTILLEGGASCEGTDGFGGTPLHAVAALKEGATALAMLRALLGAGYSGMMGARDSRGRTPLIVAAKVAGAEVVSLFVRAGSDVNAASDAGRTPLLVAISNPDPDVALLLLDAGASAEPRDRDGRSALGAALLAPQLRPQLIAELLRPPRFAGVLQLGSVAVPIQGFVVLCRALRRHPAVTGLDLRETTVVVEDIDTTQPRVPTLGPGLGEVELLLQSNDGIALLRLPPAAALGPHGAKATKALERIVQVNAQLGHACDPSKAEQWDGAARTQLCFACASLTKLGGVARLLDGADASKRMALPGQPPILMHGLVLNCAAPEELPLLKRLLARHLELDWYTGAVLNGRPEAVALVAAALADLAREQHRRPDGGSPLDAVAEAAAAGHLGEAEADELTRAVVAADPTAAAPPPEPESAEDLRAALAKVTAERDELRREVAKQKRAQKAGGSWLDIGW